MTTAEKAIAQIKEDYKKTPYGEDYRRAEYMEGEGSPPFRRQTSLLMSVVIPARNEFPNIAHTVHSILNCWEADGYDNKQIEIIIVDNCSDEQTIYEKYYSHPVDNGTSSYLEARGCFYTGTVRTLHDPIAGNHSARNKGAEMARGKYVFFSDAHMSYRPGFFRLMMKAVDESKGVVHAGIAWMGTYPPAQGTVGMQYTLKLGDDIRGTWGPYIVVPDDWFYIFGLGHCSVMCDRNQFLDFGGYPKFHRTYGGGEFYINAKWWMMGSSSVVHPQAIGYHLKSFRGYAWHHDDYTQNVMNIAYALGMDDWLERNYINLLRKGNKKKLDEMMEKAKKEMAPEREFIMKNKKRDFNDLLIERTWDKMNMEKHGRKNSSMLIFHDTWLDVLKNGPQQAIDAYENSQYQKGLEEFINTYLDDVVYKRQAKKK